MARIVVAAFLIVLSVIGIAVFYADMQCHANSPPGPRIGSVMLMWGCP